MPIGLPRPAAPDPMTDLKRRFTELEGIVARLVNAPSLENATIGQGGVRIINGGSFTVIDPATGHQVAYIGHSTIPDGSGRTQMITQFRRDDNSPGIAIGDFGTSPGHAHQQAVAWYDRVPGNVVFADDTLGGVGIARPYMSMGQWVDNLASGSFASPTTSGTFVTQQVLDAYIQHPRFRAVVIANSTSTGTTGEVCVIDPYGHQVGPALTVPANAVSYLGLGPVAYTSWNFGDTGTFQLQCRRTAGTGSIGVRGISAWGVGS